MNHPEDDAIDYACGELVGDPQPLLKHLEQCTSCSDTVEFIQNLTTTLREEGRREREQGKKRPSLEELFKRTGLDKQEARDLIEKLATAERIVEPIDTELARGVSADEKVSLREKLKSAWLSFTDFPRLQPALQPVPMLSKDKQPAHIRRISLADAFGVAQKDLERDLPWCGPNVEIARTLTETASEPVYAAYASEAVVLPRDELSTNHLVITLKGPDDERCIARLSGKQKAVIFEGDRLPEDLESIKVELVLEEE